MSYIIQCECGQQMTVQDQQQGIQAICVRCRATISIPLRPSSPGTVPIAARIEEGGQTEDSRSSNATGLLDGPPEPPPDKPTVTRDHPPSPPPTTPDFGGDGGSGGMAPHRANLILGLGIASILMGVLFCCCSFLGVIPGILALVWGLQDLQSMDRRQMDPSGRQTTIAGLICAGIGIFVSLGMGFSGWWLTIPGIPVTFPHIGHS